MFSDDEDISLLLTRFNRRESSAFAIIYKKMFYELIAYASRLYENTSVSAEDAVQDAFCIVWERRNLTFESSSKIKAFMFVVIKNNYRNYLLRSQLQQQYHDAAKYDAGFRNDILDSELVSILLEYVKRMPDPPGKIMSLLLSGYAPEEIAETMKLSIRTVYNTKYKVVTLLKKAFSSKKP